MNGAASTGRITSLGKKFELCLGYLAVLAMIGGVGLGAPGSVRAAVADDPPLDPQLNEQVLSIPIGTWQKVNLQVTFFKPDGPGPFPVAVLNHGKDRGYPKDEKRYRSAYAARYFLSRGYAVVLPMMRGFAGSEGDLFVHGCDLEDIGASHARDIHRVIDALPRSSIGPFLMRDRIVVFGQSLGGWGTLAVGAEDIPGVRGLVNFAGGIEAPNCPGWRLALVNSAGHFGQKTKVPSIWFYGDNDSKFSPTVWGGMIEQYNKHGGHAELVAYGSFLDDAHNFLGHAEAIPIWMPKLDAFLGAIGLPNQSIHPELLPVSYPPASGYASIVDLAALPLVSDKGREDYHSFLSRPMPRVFLIGSNGATVVTDGGFDPLGRGLGLCAQHNLRCQSYAIDDYVVWPKPMAIPPATTFAKLDDVAAVPFVNAGGKAGYQRFLTLPKPRAFVIASDGAWFLSSHDFDSLKKAMSNCEAKHPKCQPYAVDDAVVWPAS